MQGHLLIEGQEQSLLRKVREAKDFDESVVKAVEELKCSGMRTLCSEEWSEEQGLTLFCGKVYVPRNMKL